MAARDMDAVGWAFDIDSFIKEFPVPGGDDPSLQSPWAIWSSLRFLYSPSTPPPVYISMTRLGIQTLSGKVDQRKGGGQSHAMHLVLKHVERRCEGISLTTGRTPKVDKCAILSDAVRMVTQLRDETRTLKETNKNLLQKISDLKVKKNELRDEKQRLKT